MIKRILTFFITSLFAYATLVADPMTLGEVAFEQHVGLIIRDATKEEIPPFGIIARGYWVGKGKVEHANSQRIGFADGEVDLTYTQKLTGCDGITYILGVDTVRIDYNQNPFFSRKNFRSLDIGVLGYTTRFKKWLWQIGMAAQPSLDYDGWGRYTHYSYLIWGRYDYCKTLGIHAGFYAFSNLRRDKVFPIFGVDWSPNAKWQFNLVFPMSIAACYCFKPYLSMCLAWRPFYDRHRFGRNDVIPKGIWENHNNGTELSLDFKSPQILGSIYAGYTYGGTLKVMNMYGNDPIYFKYGPAPYAGLRAIYRF